MSNANEVSKQDGIEESKQSEPYDGFVCLKDEGKVPSILIVARSSNGTPKSWGVPSAYLAGEQEIWLAAYRAHTGDMRGDDEVQLLWARHVKTRFVPQSIPPTDAQIVESLPPQHRKNPDGEGAVQYIKNNRYFLKRAFHFTGYINDFLRAAPQSPTILSIGLDGFTCSAERLQQWLPTVPAFQLAILTRDEWLDVGQVESGGWWIVILTSEEINDALSNAPGARAEVLQLMEYWRELQHAKDMIRRSMRNRIGRAGRRADEDEDGMNEDGAGNSDSSSSENEDDVGLEGGNIDPRLL
ncbi:hypothetical protein FB567DRAFT_327107 [Paraphoma chrysanthemicola]|uniref:Uncharacterized protein n=1 Tax=Paraphoma chrysanthemicola TaxID=798071 RepID=A0A8K0RB87_9PLEO|nr:hypothetical protein FB567DRAFT_327107 [Paraphoma chrysanthemicola]